MQTNNSSYTRKEDKSDTWFFTLQNMDINTIWCLIMIMLILTNDQDKEDTQKRAHWIKYFCIGFFAAQLG